MSKRFSRKERHEINRTQRKARWIRARNHMRLYPECAYSGDFYCNHVYDPRYPWCWVDFRFFHTRLKKYFAVALTTIEYKEWHKDADRALTLAEEKYPREDTENFNIDRDELNEWINRERTSTQLARDEMEKSLGLEFNKQVRMAKPEILVKDYGPVTVGVWATVNKPFIDEHVIREFIEHYRSLGEPITPGYTWYGDETEVLPQDLNDRYPNAA
jgi:hypothetical protein